MRKRRIAPVGIGRPADKRGPHALPLSTMRGAVRRSVVSYRRDVDDVRQSALNALDELVEIYRSTDPALGAASEKSKQSKALAALRLASSVTSELIEWAESHVMGAIYREDHGKNKSNFKEDSHANELQLFGDEIELTANQWRLFIGRIIREMAPSSRD